MTNLGDIIELLVLMSTIILSISEIRRRRAESAKLSAEAKNLGVSTDSLIMNEIKKASFDLVTQLKADKAEIREANIKLETENEHLRAVVIDQEIRLAKCERCLQEYKIQCSQ